MSSWFGRHVPLGMSFRISTFDSSNERLVKLSHKATMPAQRRITPKEDELNGNEVDYFPLTRRLTDGSNRCSHVFPLRLIVSVRPKKGIGRRKTLSFQRLFTRIVLDHAAAFCSRASVWCSHRKLPGSLKLPPSLINDLTKPLDATKESPDAVSVLVMLQSPNIAFAAVTSAIVLPLPTNISHQG
jgi:hypothetical protein